MDLWAALNLQIGDVIALVGGGGKTTSLLALGLAGRRRSVKTLLTTTTQMFFPDGLPVIFGNEQGEAVIQLLRTETVVFWADKREGPKVKGVCPEILCRLPLSETVTVIEADGAKGKPLKGHRDYEPVIPSCTTLVVPVVGLDGVGQPLSEETVHRPELAAAVMGIRQGETVTAEAAARLLIHSRGLMKGVPPKARVVPLLNKATADKRPAVAEIITNLRALNAPFSQVVFGEMGVKEPWLEAVNLW